MLEGEHEPFPDDCCFSLRQSWARCLELERIDVLEREHMFCPDSCFFTLLEAGGAARVAAVLWWVEARHVS